MITVSKFGTYHDEPVYLYTIENEHHSQLKVLSYAATWFDFIVVEHGAPHSLVTHLNSFADYVQTPYMVGKTVGRVAGRIGHAAFDLAGQHYQLQPNNGQHLLHGGEHGLQTHNFKGHFDPAGDTVELTTTLRSVEDGFPGDLDVTVSYTLTATDEVRVKYRGHAQATTLFNPTCHVYFNIGDDDELVNHQTLQIASTKLVKTDNEKVPTGVFYVPSPAYDFTRPTLIQHNLDKLVYEAGKTEYDNCYVLDAPNVPAGRLTSRQRAIEFKTDRNGLIIFTANPKHQPTDRLGAFHALAVELQTLPDAINHSGFGDIVLPAGATRTFINYYQYLRLDD
mgnify:CR=1 FL=1